MTGQILLTIIMVLFFIIPLVLHHFQIINILEDEKPFTLLALTGFIISTIYLIVAFIVFIVEHWNTPIF